jgi:hypothetical protein
MIEAIIELVMNPGIAWLLGLLCGAVLVAWQQSTARFNAELLYRRKITELQTSVVYLEQELERLTAPTDYLKPEGE